MATTATATVATMIIVGGAPAATAASNQSWLLGNSFGGYGDQWCLYGTTGDIPVVGDWDGNGTDEPGVYRNGTWYLSNGCDSVAATYTFGVPGDKPVVGDWDGDGVDTPGVVRGNVWYLTDSWVHGVPTYPLFEYGLATDVPVAGDWDGNGADSVGVVRGTTWGLSNQLDGGGVFGLTYGAPGDTPVVGDWDGNGADSVGVVRGTTWGLSNQLDGDGVFGFTYEPAGGQPVVGDWDGTGTDTPGVVRQTSGWSQTYFDDFNGAGAPAGWSVHGPGTPGPATKNGSGQLDVGYADSIWTDGRFSYPVGTRVRVTARAIMPTQGIGYASFWVQQPNEQDPREIDVIESYGQSKNIVQVASHLTYPHDARSWTRSVAGRFTMSKPWQSYVTYQAEWTVGGDIINFRAFDAGGAMIYDGTSAGGKVVMTGAGRVPDASGFKLRLSNKPVPQNPQSGPGSSSMMVDWVKVETSSG